MLDVVGAALRRKGLEAARFPKGVAPFTAPDSRVSFLLAPVARANNGLTLVNAVNVFLLEQPACAAVELQCVNRVHRVGQTRPTTVYRYVVKDTIEDAIYEYHRTHTASVEEDAREAEINAAKLLSAHVLRKRQKASDSSSSGTDASDDAPASD